jgi:hypothetical protein
VLVAHALILATQEAEVRRIAVQSQPRKIGGVAQSVDPEFKPQYHKNK